MSFIGSIFDDSKGAGFQGKGAGVVSPVTKEQADMARYESENALTRQKQFVDALGAQNGIQNQSSVFGQQQALANQLGQQALGGGPNPALAQLANTTGQNVSNQAALMASQRGTGANPALLARQAAMQGANIQQQAVGQGAALRAQQQLAAQGQLQQQQNMLGGLSTQQVGQQAGAIGNLNQAAQNEQQMLLNSIAGQNQANVGMQSNINNVNSSIARGNQQFQQGILSSAGNGLAMMAQGGAVQHMDDGGSVGNGPKSFFAKYLNNSQSSQDEQSGNGSYNAGYDMGNNLINGLKKLIPHKGISSNAMDANLPGKNMMMAYSGGTIDMTSGGKLPGRASVKGDSLKNDKVPIMGSPGEIMLPRSVTQHKDAPRKAAEFVAAILAKNNMGKQK